MANRESMPLLTKLEELNARPISINISLLTELVHTSVLSPSGDWDRAWNAGRIQYPAEHVYNLGIKLPPFHSCSLDIFTLVATIEHAVCV